MATNAEVLAAADAVTQAYKDLNQANTALANAQAALEQWKGEIQVRTSILVNAQEKLKQAQANLNTLLKPARLAAV